MISGATTGRPPKVPKVTKDGAEPHVIGIHTLDSITFTKSTSTDPIPLNQNNANHLKPGEVAVSIKFLRRTIKALLAELTSLHASILQLARQNDQSSSCTTCSSSSRHPGSTLRAPSIPAKSLFYSMYMSHHLEKCKVPEETARVAYCGCEYCQGYRDAVEFILERYGSEQHTHKGGEEGDDDEDDDELDGRTRFLRMKPLVRPSLHRPVESSSSQQHVSVLLVASAIEDMWRGTYLNSRIHNILTMSDLPFSDKLSDFQDTVEIIRELVNHSRDVDMSLEGPKPVARKMRFVRTPWIMMSDGTVFEGTVTVLE